MHPALATAAISGLVYRAWAHKSLTTLGIVVAFFTAIAHAVHPSPLPFTLLTVFFLAGSKATKVHHDTKAQLTISAGSSGDGEGPRNHIQVLANSGLASVLCLLHAWQIRREGRDFRGLQCGSNDDILLVGVIANYATVTADTLSSELGILSRSQPRLITSPTLRKVPRGTNGGVTALGVLAGSLGAALIGVTTAALAGQCSAAALAGASLETVPLLSKVPLIVAVTIWGTLGSVVDSLLGGLLQESVLDRRTGKIIEGSGGRKVIKPREAEVNNRARRRSTPSAAATAAWDSAAGLNILDNNQVNLLTAGLMSVSAMAMASQLWNTPAQSMTT